MEHDDFAAEEPAPAGAEEFGRGWSAVHTPGGWLLLEPVENACGEPRPHELPGGLLCIVTSDNPYGRSITSAENLARRERLHRWAAERHSEWLVTGGGEGSLLAPDRWDGFEEGVIVPIRHYGEAAEACRTFEQAAVYVLENVAGHEERVLVNAACEVFRRQHYRVHRLSAEIGASAHRTR